MHGYLFITLRPSAISAEQQLSGSSIRIERCTSDEVTATYSGPSSTNIDGYEVVLNCTEDLMVSLSALIHYTYTLCFCFLCLCAL